jgi:hypothetical protein
MARWGVMSHRSRAEVSIINRSCSAQKLARKNSIYCSSHPTGFAVCSPRRWSNYGLSSTANRGAPDGPRGLPKVCGASALFFFFCRTPGCGVASAAQRAVRGSATQRRLRVQREAAPRRVNARMAAWSKRGVR